jgi:hypothetical protein
MPVSETTVVLQQTVLETILGSILIFSVTLLTIASQWAVFTEAGFHGWAAVVPFYNVIVILWIGDNAWWWLLVIIFVPILNLYGLYRMFVGVSRAFGNGIGFGLGLCFLPFIFWPLLAFGDYSYQGTG